MYVRYDVVHTVWHVSAVAQICSNSIRYNNRDLITVVDVICKYIIELVIFYPF